MPLCYPPANAQPGGGNAVFKSRTRVFKTPTAGH